MSDESADVCACCGRDTGVESVGGRVVCIVCGSFYREYGWFPDERQQQLGV